jgi:2-(3-amino-3-carboxypropyl)histidine synthase
MKIGLEIVNDVEKGTIFGCWFSDLLETIKKSDGVIVVSGGEFHPLGVGLYLNNSKPIISLDPYTDTFRSFNKLIYRILKERYYKILRASEARAWMIIAGVQGQFRPAIVEKLKQEIEERGNEYFIARSAYVTRETLGNIDSKEIDAFIITSCPRLPIDDLHDFYKPVLTPGEAFMIFDNASQRYIYPW